MSNTLKRISPECSVIRNTSSNTSNGREVLEDILVRYMENFADKGLLGTNDSDVTLALLVYDPYEEPSVSFGIDYHHYFWEVFGAIEDPILKGLTDEEPMAYIRRIRENFRSNPGAVTDDQITV